MSSTLSKNCSKLSFLITERGTTFYRLINSQGLHKYNISHRHSTGILNGCDKCFGSQLKIESERSGNDEHFIWKISSKNYSTISKINKLNRHAHVLGLRSYSQTGQQGSNKKQYGKWISIISAGLAGGVGYKYFFSNNLSDDSSDHYEVSKPEDIFQNIFKYPENSKNLPDSIPYLLIGGGTAAFSAFRAIKAFDSTAKVLMITDEPYNPYMRPPLSKELILNKSKDSAKTLSFTQWDGSVRSVFYEPNEFYIACEELNDSENGGVSVARGWKVTRLNPDEKYIILDDGKRINYNKCLLATGAEPKNLPVFTTSDPEVQKKVTLYRSLDDFLKLERVIENGAKSIVIVGGGFNGSELACSLSRRGLQVTQVYKEAGNMAQVLPKYLSNYVTSKIQEQGVRILPNSSIEGVKKDGQKIQIITDTKEFILADHVIVTVGVKPNTSLASAAGLETDATFGGYLVNAELQARNDLYAAGDCACFYDKQLGRRRVEHHDHAVVSGRLAGENMTGAGKTFTHQSMFWSDLGPGMGYEAIGIIDSSLPTVSVYAQEPMGKSESKNDSDETSLTEEEISIDSPEEYHKGIIFYLRNNEVVGIVMWNLFNRISIARQVLKSNIGLKDLQEVSKLFNISENH